MKECDILRGDGQNIYSDLPTYFMGGPDPTNPQDLRRCMVSHPSCRRSMGEDSIWAMIYDMRIVDDGSPAPTFWSFVLGHDNLSPVEQQRHWLEDTVCLELIRHEDGSIVIISKIQI